MKHCFFKQCSYVWKKILQTLQIYNEMDILIIIELMNTGFHGYLRWKINAKSCPELLVLFNMYLFLLNSFSDEFSS